MVEKRWGSEEIVFHGPYLVKRLVIKPGKATSMHYHNCKTETIVVLEGTLEIAFKHPETEVQFKEGRSRNTGLVTLSAGESLTIFEGWQSSHSMRSKFGCTYLEASTPHTVDSVRDFLCDDWRPQ